MSAEVLGSGRVAVVTGAGSGIGAALAAAFGAEGCAVVLADVQEDALEHVATELSGRGIDVLAVHTDVSNALAVEHLAQVAVDRFERVDVVCNNAGVSTFNLLADQTLSDWEWVLGVNLWGVIHGVHSFLPILRGQRTPAHIVNTASVAGLLSSLPFIGPYAVSKVGVVSLSETLSAEMQMAGLPIGVSVLCPSSVDTNVMEAERNRPAALGFERRSDAAENMRLLIRDSFSGPAGKAAAEIAAMVIDAIRNDRFWIITHGTERPAIVARFAAIEKDMPLSAG